jgi:hypothetical protein
MKNDSNDLSIDQVLSMTELLTDQIQDLRVKLNTECKPDMIPFRLSVVTHYRNMRITLLSKIDREKISRRELLGLIHQN